MGIIDKYRAWQLGRYQKDIEKSEREIELLRKERKILEGEGGRRTFRSAEENLHSGFYGDFLKEWGEVSTVDDRMEVIDEYVRQMMEKGWKKEDGRRRLLEALWLNKEDTCGLP